jgi:7-keto-8-aminopelargonate synthetase-like enzyme
MVDEAHSLGVLGETGRGVNEYFRVDPSSIDIFTGSLSKTIPANGGFIAAKEEVIVYLKHGGAPYMFSAALSPANTAAAIKAIEVIEEECWRIKKLWKNTTHLIRALNDAGINTGNSQTPVIPVICGSNERAFKFSKNMFDRGFLANAVIYPAVPINKARLRLCCTASHSPEVIEEFVTIASSVYQNL